MNFSGVDAWLTYFNASICRTIIVTCFNCVLTYPSLSSILNSVNEIEKGKIRANPNERLLFGHHISILNIPIVFIICFNAIRPRLTTLTISERVISAVGM